MSIITSQQVHARNWMRCPSCEGRPWTAEEARKGCRCITCDNAGEIPRHRPVNIWAGYSTFHECQAGA